MKNSIRWRKDMAKFGFIGFGHRGINMLECLLDHIDGYEIVAICDLMEERVEEAKSHFEKRGLKDRPYCKMNGDFCQVNCTGSYEAPYV